MRPDSTSGPGVDSRDGHRVAHARESARVRPHGAGTGALTLVAGTKAADDVIAQHRRNHSRPRFLGLENRKTNCRRRQFPLSLSTRTTVSRRYLSRRYRSREGAGGQSEV